MILENSELFGVERELLERLWSACGQALYSLSPREQQLGLQEEGISTYYSTNCTTTDAELVQTLMQKLV